MITGLEHIAIAVSDLPTAIKRFCEDFGCTLQGEERVTAAQTDTAFLAPLKTQLELIAPMDGKGPVQKYMDKRGGGIHHLCFRSDNLLEDRDRLMERGYQFISPTPQPGAHGTQVLWIHPKSTEGVLIELVEHPNAAERPH